MWIYIFVDIYMWIYIYVTDIPRLEAAWQAIPQGGEIHGAIHGPSMAFRKSSEMVDVSDIS